MLEFFLFDSDDRFFKFILQFNWRKYCGRVITNSFIHMIDDDFIELFPYKIYSDNLIKCNLLTNNKMVDRRQYYYLTPDLRKKIKPIKMHDLLKEQHFYRYMNDKYSCYAIELQPFLEYGKSLARTFFEAEHLPVWHEKT